MKREAITMPVLSDTMQSGRLIDWQKQPGDKVRKGDILAEVESDKAVMDLEAFADGYLVGPLAQPGSEIPTGTVIGYLSDTPDAAGHPDTERTDTPPAAGEPAAPAPETETVAAPPEPTAAGTDNAPATPRASPYARGLAGELNIPLRQIRPGPDGTIRAPQVLATALSGPQPDLEAGPPYRYKLFTPMHRAVADNMSATVHTPMFRVSANLPTAALQQAAHERRISFTLLLTRATALTIQAHPGFNMAYTPFGLAERERIDIGIAVDIPGGLVTPVIHDAGGRRIDELEEEWRILRSKIGRQRLSPEDYRGATFYISNMGVFPLVRSFDAIVPLGAAAILAVGASSQGHATMTLSCDHRVVYGADAARFLQTLEQRLAEPEHWLEQSP